MQKPPSIAFIEDHFGRKAPVEPFCAPMEGVGITKGSESSIVIVGGGIAGPAFARKILSAAVAADAHVQITLISRPSCNYCGGLITNLSLQTMRNLYDYEPASEVVVSRIEEVLLVNPRGSASVAFESPLASVFRTSRFGQPGMDDNFRQHILSGLPEAATGMITVVEPGVATSIEVPDLNKPGTVTYVTSEGANQIKADLVVIATGLRSLESKFVASFRRQTGYIPPEVMPASVTEIDVTANGSSSIGRRMLILNGIIKNSVVALIPKQTNWITVAALQKVLTLDDLHIIFDHPSVREYIEVEGVDGCLPCGRVCSSGVYTKPARNFYGNGWVVLGDLTGYGRVLKDGYFGALLGAELAAHAAATHGFSREAFRRHYHKPLDHFRRDNRAGIGLFRLNNMLSRSNGYNESILSALLDETGRYSYGGLAHCAFRALSTGELSYSLITTLFLGGLLSWSARNPARAIRALLR